MTVNVLETAVKVDDYNGGTTTNTTTEATATSQRFRKALSPDSQMPSQNTHVETINPATFNLWRCHDTPMSFMRHTSFFCCRYLCSRSIPGSFNWSLGWTKSAYYCIVTAVYFKAVAIMEPFVICHV